MTTKQQRAAARADGFEYFLLRLRSYAIVAKDSVAT
jgi:hypothetical protein